MKALYPLAPLGRSLGNKVGRVDRYHADIMLWVKALSFGNLGLNGFLIKSPPPKRTVLVGLSAN